LATWGRHSGGLRPPDGNKSPLEAGLPARCRLHNRSTPGTWVNVRRSFVGIALLSALLALSAARFFHYLSEGAKHGAARWAIAADSLDRSFGNRIQQEEASKLFSRFPCILIVEIPAPK
jgi:hypothetical protein